MYVSLLSLYIPYVFPNIRALFMKSHKGRSDRRYKSDQIKKKVLVIFLLTTPRPHVRVMRARPLFGGGLSDEPLWHSGLVNPEAHLAHQRHLISQPH
jgi:hypothetical protein